MLIKALSFAYRINLIKIILNQGHINAGQFSMMLTMICSDHETIVILKTIQVRLSLAISNSIVKWGFDL
jgi:hypothetical protein